MYSAASVIGTLSYRNDSVIGTIFLAHLFGAKGEYLKRITLLSLDSSPLPSFLPFGNKIQRENGEK